MFHNDGNLRYTPEQQKVEIYNEKKSISYPAQFFFLYHRLHFETCFEYRNNHVRH